MDITLNHEKNGIEVRFDGIPDSSVRDLLKQYGFRWSSKQKMWWAKNTEDRMNMLENIGGNISCYKTSNIKDNDEVFDLWGMTRTDNIGNHVDKSMTCKDISASIRKHLRQRFPMCKWSVSIPYYNHIHIRLKSSPWKSDSDEVEAIVHYAAMYGDSYRYCTDYDPYGDYGSSYNIDRIYEPAILDRIEYLCIQMDDEMVSAISKKFVDNQATWEEQERIRQEEEFQAYLIKMEEEKAEYERLRTIRNANHELVEKNAEAKDADYFVRGCYTTNTRKEDHVEGYFEEDPEDIVYHREDCKVEREVYLSKECYDLFASQLMDDWSFLEKMGGSSTDDPRINSMEDYSKMTKEERATVKWYNTNCVAVFSDFEMKIVIDPQGFDYARYVFFLDDKSIIEKTMEV